jgi:hypothetical protein
MRNPLSTLDELLIHRRRRDTNQFFKLIPNSILAHINRLAASYYVIREDEYILPLIADRDARIKVQKELASGHQLYLVLEPNGSPDRVGDIYNKSGALLCRLGTRKVIRYFYFKNYGADGENPLLESEINRVLHYIALGDPTNALAILTANPALLDQSGYVITQTGDLLWDVKPLECMLSLGEHYADMIPPALPLFDFIEGGEEIKQKQLAKYKDALLNIGNELRYKFQWIVDIIKKSSTADVSAALNKVFTHESVLRDSLIKYRQDFSMRVITNGLVCPYATVHEVLKMYEKNFDALKAASENKEERYDKCRLVWRQMAGFIFRRRVTDRQSSATGHMVVVRDNAAAVLARTYKLKYNQGQFYEPCRDFLVDHDEVLSDGAGWDFCVDVYGTNTQWWPHHSSPDFWNTCRTKTTSFRNIMQQSLQQQNPHALTNERSGCVMF